MRILFTSFAFLTLFSVSLSQPKNVRKPNLENGKYITERVAMCVQCHTPREANGDLIGSKLFEGAAIPVERPSQFRLWAEFAPRIAGLPQYSTEQFIRLVTTGIGKEGKPLRSPMPTFKLSIQDAQDVEAFLRDME